MSLRARFVACLALLALLLGARSAAALTFQYCDFSNVSTLTMNGSAAQSGTLLRLTPATNNLAGSSYRTTAIPWTASTDFHAFFRFQILPNATGANGLAFILQNVGVTALGPNGGEMGYGGIGSSVEVEFDTHQNTWDPNGNHVGIMLDGAYNVHLAVGTPSFTMANAGVLFAWVDYAAATQTLSVYLAQSGTKPATPLATTTVNVGTAVGAQAFAGFTAATGGGGVNEHDVLEFEFSTSGEPCSCEGNAGCSDGTPICGTAGVCRACVASDCTGATPYCAPAGNPKAGQCVACLTDANCDANLNTNTPICDQSMTSLADTCRACQSNPECVSPLAPVCDTSGAHLGQCVTCQSNTDCTGNPNGPVCFDNGTTNVCVQCTSNANCGGTTPVCNASHQCVPCASDADCSVPTPACQTSGPLQGSCTQCSATNTSQCTGTTPLCDLPTGTCVGCESNADCAGNTPICNLATKTCRACQSNADCSTFPGKVCDTSGMKAGECVVCVLNSDCSAPTPLCDPASNTCVQCESNADCSGGTPICNLTTHTCGACTSDADCSLPTPACQQSGPLQGQCTQCSGTNMTACVAPTPVCNTSTGTCAGCLTNSDCSGNTPICDPMMLVCRACQVNAECASFPGKVCDMAGGARNGECVVCATNSDCSAPTPWCDPSTNTCVACITNAQCSGNKPTCSQTTHTCIACMSDSDCAAPTPACQTSGPLMGNCTQCSGTNATECSGNTPVCDTLIGSCGCIGPPGCPTGQVCDTNLPPAGQCVPAPDGGVDAGTDAATTDGGGDAGAPDATTMDSGTFDAGPRADSGSRDSGFVESGGFADGAGGGEGGQLSDAGDIAGAGCSCRTAGSGTGGRLGDLCGWLLAAAVLGGRRRRRSG